MGGRASQLGRKFSIMYGMCAAVTKYFFSGENSGVLVVLDSISISRKELVLDNVQRHIIRALR